MDKFDKAEQTGRALFTTILQQLQVSDYQEATEKYDTLDMFFTINEKYTGVEIKKRDKQFESYPTYMMEVYKFKALWQRLKDNEFEQIYYVNFFGEDTVYIFPLRKIAEGIKKGKVIVTSTYANRTTAVFQGKTEKRILLIPKEYAAKLVRIDNKWYNANKLNKQ